MHRTANNQLAGPSLDDCAGVALVLSPFNMAMVRFCFFFTKYQRMAKRWTATNKIMKVLPKPLCQEVARLTLLPETRLTKGPALEISSSLMRPVLTCRVNKANMAMTAREPKGLWPRKGVCVTEVLKYCRINSGAHAN